MLSVLEPFDLAGVKLCSRFVRSATAERVPILSAEDGRKLGEFYAALAIGGVGMIVTGHIAAHPRGKVGPFMAGLFEDAQIAPWRAAVDAAHKAGGIIVAQINHGGGRCQPQAVGTPLCVSRVERGKDSLQGDEMTGEQIEEIVDAFASAARRAKEAGFNGVQIHAAHGYLGSQFLSPLANHRSDEWGGSLDGRARFLRRVAAAIRAALGPRFLLGMKLGALDAGANGLTVEDTLQAAKWFEEDGLDFIEISGAFHPGVITRNVKPGKGEGYYAAIAKRFKAALSIPVVAVGGFRSLEMMNDALNAGVCDLIALSRPLIRQPDLPNILRNGGETDCVSCNLCLMTRDAETACQQELRRQAHAR